MQQTPKFQSTLPHGSDRYRLQKAGSQGISIHAPSRERPTELLTPPPRLLFQSTLPHGSDTSGTLIPALNLISIHAPSRERLLPFSVSKLCLIRFQSTLPHGSDRTISIITILSTSISIHAPSRERLRLAKAKLTQCLFQSTLPHGSDDIIMDNVRALRSDFNPRSLTGATRYYIESAEKKQISIHAPSRERQAAIIDCRRLEAISIHAPSRERPVSDEILRTSADFNPRSLTGAT